MNQKGRKMIGFLLLLRPIEAQVSLNVLYMNLRSYAFCTCKCVCVCVACVYVCVLHVCVCVCVCDGNVLCIVPI
jgi:hypothetical protein